MDTPLRDLVSFSFIETNGIRLHTAMAGRDDAATIVLLHGFPEFWFGWRKQIPILAEAGFQVIVPDQRGYNLSEKPRGIRAYQIEELAKDIVGLCDRMGKESIYLAGHDWGAAVAWHLAEHYPNRVEKLAILNVPHPQVMIQTLRSSLGQIFKSWYIFLFQLPWLPEKLLAWSGYLAMRWMMVASSRPDSLSKEDLGVYVKAWSQPGALTGMLNWYRAIFRERGMDYLRRSEPATPQIKVPTLMLWGTQDMALSREMAQPSIDLCAQGELHYFDHATHWLQLDEAEEVNRLLVDFFE